VISKEMHIYDACFASRVTRHKKVKDINADYTVS